MVKAHVQLPRLGIEGEINFLVDTGADHTSILPGDASIRLDVYADYNNLAGATPVRTVGVGGGQRYWLENARLTFAALDGHTLSWTNDILICDRIDDTELFETMKRLPSLLGRDFINLCDLHANAINNQFTLNPVCIENQNIVRP